ncbi:30S ribosomal protein S18 [soil metagenome]
MAPKKSKSKPRKKIIANLKCYFCETKRTPNYLEVEELQKFVTERGKILNRAYSGVCTKHQKRVAIAVKRARHLGLLPFKGAM